VALAVKEDVTLDPVDVRFLGAAAVVTRTNVLTNLVEQLSLRRTVSDVLAHCDPSGVVRHRFVSQSDRGVRDTHTVPKR
jgi:hypothetical protein